MSDWITTSTLLNRLSDFDDANAWQRVHERFRQPVIALARKVGLSQSDSDDVAQETLAAFAESVRRGTFDREKGRLSAWLFGIAYRQAANARRKRNHSPDAAAGADPASLLGAIPAESETVGTWELEWEKAILEQCLAQVRGEVAPPTFQAFHMSVVENRPTEEICAALGLSREAVYVAKHRVLKRLRDARDELESSA